MSLRIFPALSASEEPEQDRYSPETAAGREASASAVPSIAELLVALNTDPFTAGMATSPVALAARYEVAMKALQERDA
jgi:hypothetical protein